MIKQLIRAFSNLESVNLLHHSVKILGCHHSYNKELAGGGGGGGKNSVKAMTDIQNVLNLWSMRCLSLLGKVQNFKNTWNFKN